MDVARHDALVDGNYAGLEGALVNGVKTYKRVNNALEDAPTVTKPYLIFIKNGHYFEKLDIVEPNITLIGESRDETVLKFDAASDRLKPDGTRYGTSGSASVTVHASDFRAEHLTIENGFDYPTNAAKAIDDPTRFANPQAVALKTDKGSCRTFFQDVRLVGYQDTLFADSGAQYFFRCSISGHIDFIFGAGQAVFEDCEIVSRDRSSTSNTGYITAASTRIIDSYGFLFINSRLKKETPVMADGSVALGRPWHPTTDLPDGTRAADPSAVGCVVFKNCWMDSHVSTKGWDPMSGRDKDGKTIWFYPEDSRFFEYGSVGPGAIKSTSRRVLSESSGDLYYRKRSGRLEPRKVEAKMHLNHSLALSIIIAILILALSGCSPAAPPPTQTPPAPTLAAATPTVAPTPTTVAVPSGPLITDLVVRDAATAANWSIASNLQANDQQFGDRSYYISKLPDAYAGSAWIRTAADAKKFIGDVLATFKVTADADVYVAHDDRILTKPAWLKDWKDTGDDVLNTETTPTTLSVYKKSFLANSTVTLGENAGSTGALGYMVFVRRPGEKPVIAPSKLPVANLTCKWEACLGMVADWYGTAESVRIADNLLLYQRNTGGWNKGIDMAVVLTDAAKATLQKEKANTNDSTLDNSATTSQIIYLARVYNATKQDRFKDGFIKGLDYLLQAQYSNGGWPQYYPVDASLYYARITYNDNAMINVMTLLRDVSKDPAFIFVDADRRSRADKAVQKGIELIVKSQIVVKGKKTAWCAQHDEKTLAPALARSYELPSISGQESVGIVRYLMTIEKPSQEIIDAIQAAVKWMDDSKILGLQVMDKPDASLPGGYDRVAVPNPSAPPIWARFYDLDTNVPFFVGREGVKKSTLAEIEHERRVGYSYYTNAPAYLLANDYPAWQTKNGVPTVLSKPVAAPAATSPTAAPTASAASVPALTQSGSTAPALAAKKQSGEVLAESFEKGTVGEFPLDWLILDKENHTTNKSGPRVSSDVQAAEGKLAIRVTSNPTSDGQMNRDFSPLPLGRLIFYGMVPNKDSGFTSVELRDGGTRLFNLEMHPEGRLRFRDQNGNLQEANVKFEYDKWYQFIMEWDAASSIWNGYVVVDGKQTRLTPENGVPFPAASKGKAPSRIQLRLNRAAEGPKVGYVDGFQLFKLE